MSISATHFKTACEALYDVWDQNGQHSDWQSCRLLNKDGVSILRITRSVKAVTKAASAQVESTVEDVSEDDDEVIDLEDQDRVPMVYDIIHSLTWQVPVLYIQVQSSKTLNLNQVYDLLVPQQNAKTMRATGVMGALTMADHPCEHLVVYMIHPCRTQEAMQAVSAAEETSPIEYLLRWFGLACACVGLNVPVPVTEALLER